MLKLRFVNFFRQIAMAFLVLLGANSARAEVAQVEALANWENGWSYSEYSNTGGFNWLTDFSHARRMCYGNGKLYVVDAASKAINVIDARTGAYLSSLNVNGVSGGAIALMDVKYVNGYVVASNLTTGLEQAIKVYYWENDEAAPVELLNTTSKEGVARVNDNFGIIGDPKGDAYIYFYGASTQKVLRYKVTGGVCDPVPEYTTVAKAGGVSPRVVPIDATYFWVDDAASDPIKYAWVSGGAATKVDEIGSTVSYKGTDVKPFTMSNGEEYAIVADFPEYSTYKTVLFR
ncbi:MAG: DUF4623 domain-containing protein [Bacteroidales bacterium]|nr:DUF4623 domain-containing protein [Bacteroidales bacterium]